MTISSGDNHRGNPESLAIAQDVESYGAELYTSPDFGCVQWRKKVPMQDTEFCRDCWRFIGLSDDLRKCGSGMGKVDGTPVKRPCPQFDRKESK